MKGKKIRIQSLEQSGIHRKIGIAFLLMSLIPIVVMVYLIQFPLKHVLSSEIMSYLQWLVFLMVCAALIGFGIIRKIASAVSSIAGYAKGIVEERGSYKRLQVNESSEEISELVKTFNRITKELEQRITMMEQTKKVNQELFQKVGSAITSSERIDNLLMLVIENMITALDAESGFLMLWQAKDGVIQSKLVCGLYQQELLKLVVKKGEGVIGWVVESGQSLMMTSATTTKQNQSVAIGIEYRSLLCIPLMYQGNVLGAVGVINKKQEESFVRDDQVLLENVGTQIAVAIENARLNADAEKTYFETISALAIAVEAKDTYTVGHLQRVSEYVERLAQEMGFSDDRVIRVIKDGAFLHDIGKIACPDHVLLKPGKLTAEEMAIMKTHTTIGESIIAPLSSFKELRAIVRHHQEWYDGSGYPDQLKGEEIPVGARILSVADVYDALTTNRPYRKALSHEVAMQMICDETGTHFDPKIVEAFVKIMQKK